VLGDRVDTNLSAAAAASLDGALVLTGDTERQALNGFEPPPVAEPKPSPTCSSADVGHRSSYIRYQDDPPARDPSSMLSFNPNPAAALGGTGAAVVTG
jgi:hypothetical protein